MSVVARLPPLVAVIVTGPPTPTPATRPVEETFAILGSADDQLSGRPRRRAGRVDVDHR